YRADPGAEPGHLTRAGARGPGARGPGPAGPARPGPTPEILDACTPCWGHKRPRSRARGRGRRSVPGLLQVRGDAAEVERPPGAEDHAQVDVLRLRDDTLVEHQPRLLGQRGQRPRPYLFGGQRLVADLQYRG